jgi:hypothetical protein
MSGRGHVDRMISRLVRPKFLANSLSVITTPSSAATSRQLAKCAR